ncbi:hypothetical protein TARUN_1458 [Trichoderma arundinaceum]|uniref:Swiss Army Knife RNA repair protein HAD domain-containing protein n=1 Tax=Trichoderma arundinaceum TaxID=490622 RepID=A0A395NZ79_TRIAR|nr:hypothetical protein TARUN_1458 [Trichoderma arundinaceum]
MNVGAHSPLKQVPFSRARSCRRPTGAYIRNCIAVDSVTAPNLIRDNHPPAQNSWPSGCITTSTPPEPEQTPSIFHSPAATAIAARIRGLSVSLSSAMASAYSAYHGAPKSSQFTVTALGRWSILTKPLPAVDKVRVLHVYDFDNTCAFAPCPFLNTNGLDFGANFKKTPVFKTPMPNPSLWTGPTIGLLATQEAFTNGGWWHDNRILAATGDGAEKEEKRAWEGWWNEKVADLVKLSTKQPDALCVLLTGRSEHGFGELIKRMVTSKGLEFDMVSLKPRVSPSNQNFQNTMHFKQLFFEALMETYRDAAEIKVYEDRPRHTKGFRDFFAEYNRRQTEMPTRGTINADVVQVVDSCTLLDPVVEVAEVQHMINQHNVAILKEPSSTKGKLMIKKTVFFTSYMIGADDIKKLLKLAHIPAGVSNSDLKFHANNILICPRPCPTSILDKVGGMGSKMLWEVTGTACFDNAIWAACVRPVPHTAKFHTDNPVPLVVLALKKGARPMDAGKITNWQPLPIEERFSFETTVGEKVILRIEPEDPKEDEYQSLFANKASKRKHNADEEWAARSVQYAGRNETRSFHTGRGRKGGNSRSHRNASRGGRSGRGRGHGYRSLDDVDPKGSQVAHDAAAQGSVGRGRPMGGQPSNGSDLQSYY